MIRIFISSLLSFSILFSSNITADNAREHLNKHQGNTALKKVEDLKKNAELSKAESQQKVVAAKKSKSEFKKDFDTKLNIAKKIYSAKTNKKSSKKSYQLNTDPNSLDLKMKGPASTNVRPKINRNIMNSAQQRDGHMDGMEVPWTGVPGELETFISQNGGSGAFILEAGKIYVTLDEILVPPGESLVLIGAEPAIGQHPATIQPGTGNENSSMFKLDQDDSEIQLHHLILNAYSPAFQWGLTHLVNDQGSHCNVVVDHCVVSGVATVVFMNMGVKTSFHVSNSTFTDFTSYQSGIFYGGVLWGGGSWMGTLKNVFFQNNTIQGVIGEAFVIYEHVENGLIDHNTFANISMNPIWYRGQNNLQVTNNLFYNNKAYGQSSFDINNWGVWYEGGVGQMALRNKNNLGYASGTGTYEMGDGTIVDMNNRNISWANNAAVWSPALTNWIDNLSGENYGDNSWSWTITDVDDYGNEYEQTYYDTMLTVGQQWKWLDDTTQAVIDFGVGVSSIDNALLSSGDLGSNIQENYIEAQLARTLDFRDNQIMDGVGASSDWVYQGDADISSVAWPLDLDISYSENSTAFTHSDLGLPIGNLHAFPDKYEEWKVLTTPVIGVEYEYSSVADLFADFGTVLESGGADCAGCEGNLDNMLEYVAGSIGGGANLSMEEALNDWSSQFNYGQYYFQFKDDNNNMTYDSGEIYAVSLENGTNGEMHTLSYGGVVYDLDFEMFWWMAYDFEFYPNDGEMDEFWIFDGEGTPPGWEIYQWGNASMSVTDGSGMYENSSALTFIQGDVWSGGGFNIAPPLHLDEMWGNGALMFWMWSEPDAPTLRLQFEDGVGKVGMHFEPAPQGGWNYYGFRLEDFYFIDGSTDFNESTITVFQVMAEGNGVAGRTFHFDEMYIGETEDDGGEPIWFDFIGDMDGRWYFVSQEPMTWHDGLNFTDTVEVEEGDVIHMATINSGEENDFINNSLNDYGIEAGVWLGLTDEFEETNWQWVTGEPFNFTNWVEGEPNNGGGMEHYAEMWPWQLGQWNDAPHDAPNHVLIEYIPGNNDGDLLVGEWQMAPMPGALRVGPEPFNGDWWANTAEDVQARACYFNDRYVFDEDGFHNDQGDDTWIEFWQGGDYNGDGILDYQDDHCGAPMYPHDGSSNPAGVVLDEAAGTLTLNGLGAYIGLPKAANGFELASPEEAPESVTYQMYMQESPRMMTLVIEVWEGVFWTFDLVPALDGEPVYFAKEDYADVTDFDNWDHVTPSVAIMRGNNQGLYNPYFEDSYNGLGPSGTLWYSGYTNDADPMSYTDWNNVVAGQANNLPGQTLSMWCLEENLYFDVSFESWTSGNNGGGFSYWRTLAEPPAGPTMHLVSGMMGSDETGDGSFENPFATIGHAMGNMSNNDWIIVAPGMYEENLVSYEMSGLLVAIAGPDSTFISGSGQNRIMEIDYGNWMIGGFTFSDGNTDGDGGAIKIHDGSLMFGGGRFVNNTAQQVGGAVAALNSDVMMDSVAFVMNHSVQASGGGLFVENTHMDEYRNVVLTNALFAENTASNQGAGVAILSNAENSYLDAYLDSVQFVNNSSYAYAGYRLYGNVWSNVNNSTFIGNQAQAYAAAGGFSGGASVDMVYCLVAGNQANLNGGTANAGGFSVWSGSYGNFYNCTFAGNSAEYGSALTVGGGSYASVDGSIVWNNPGDNALAAVQWEDNGSTLDVYNSVVQGGESGMYADDLSYLYHDGILDMDPFFCDPENGDFSIDLFSHAVTPWGEPMGALGYGCEGTVMASASIVSIEDVPNDQGGRVYITFEKSLFDTDGLGRTEMYTVERMDGDQWVGLTSVGAYSSEVYVVEVTTLADSTSEGNAMTTYRVVANMDEGNFESESASGYSVDNIAPMMVTGLNAEGGDGMVMLSWGHSDANDFSHYMIYYSNVADFIPSEETMIGTHSEPSFDHDVEEIGDHYYIVSAMDIHENESEYSEAVNVTLLSLVDVHGLPETFALHQNYPNPFNPSTTIRYDLPEASNVSLTIYDMMGREVATLMSGQVNAGYHFIQWDGTNRIGSPVAAGVYIYTIQAGKHRDVNKMIYLK